MASTYYIALTVSPATEAVMTILPPLPPFDLDILSTANITPRDAPTAITSKHFSQPCYGKCTIDAEDNEKITKCKILRIRYEGFKRKDNRLERGFESPGRTQP